MGYDPSVTFFDKNLNIISKKDIGYVGPKSFFIEDSLLYIYTDAYSSQISKDTLLIDVFYSNSDLDFLQTKLKRTWGNTFFELAEEKEECKAKNGDSLMVRNNIGYRLPVPFEQQFFPQFYFNDDELVYILKKKNAFLIYICTY